jgi:hypothetical protein
MRASLVAVLLALGFALGAMVILVGWTALRERGADEDVGSSPSGAEPAGRG